MCHYADDDEVDMVIIGCGAGGGVLAQRLARAGWRVCVLERGPFWDPERDWVSDEAGSHIYWNDVRIIGGADPVEMGKNNSGHGVGGSMVHYAGYALAFIRPTSRVDPRRRGRRLADRLPRPEAALPARRARAPGRRAGLAWGDPHSYPHSPHPICGAAERAWAGARKHGIEMRVGPVAIANGVFGNRPHCIYRGFCLQGCKVNAKASPLVTHVPDALEHGAEISADCMVADRG